MCSIAPAHIKLVALIIIIIHTLRLFFSRSEPPFEVRVQRNLKSLVFFHSPAGKKQICIENAQNQNPRTYSNPKIIFFFVENF